MKYGAHVLLYSSCQSFQARETDLPIARNEEVDGRFPLGLAELRGSKKRMGQEKESGLTQG